MTKAKTSLLTLLFCAALASSLSACQSVKRELGVGRNSPDEFMVVKRAPLSLPPDYTLRPPSSTAAATQTSETMQVARSQLLGETSAPATAGTGETALLSKMGAQDADPSIRNVINEENGYIALENRTVADKLLFWKEAETDPEAVPASQVNAKDEAARLKKNQQEGKPVNEGDVPVVEDKQSTIDKLF